MPFTILVQNVFLHFGYQKNIKIKVYTSIILLCFFFFSFGMGVKLAPLYHRKMLDTGVQEEVFDPKREEVIKEWRKLHCEELRDIFSFSDII